MYRNYSGREMLNKIFSHPVLNEKHVKLAYAQKRFCIYAQIVNTLIEVFYHENGINIYIGAKNLILCNGLYYFAVCHPNQMLVTEFEQNFVKMMRNPTVESVADFYRTTDKLRYDLGTDSRFFDFLSEIPMTIITIKQAIGVSPFYMDLTIPLFSESIQKWFAETNIKHDVLFDSSEPFYAGLNLIESLKSMEGEPIKVGYGDYKHVYPLPVGNLSIAKSHDEFGIQLADVFASALNFYLSPRKDKYQKYQNDIIQFPIFKEVEINIAPATIDFIEKRMGDVEGIDPLDYICEHIKTEI